MDALHKIPNLDPKTKNIIALLQLKKMYYTSCLNEQISRLAYEEKLLRKGKKFLTPDELKQVENLQTSLKQIATTMNNIGGDSVLYLIENAFKKSPKQLLAVLRGAVPMRKQLFKVLDSIGTAGKAGFKFSIKVGAKTLDITSDILFGVSLNSYKLIKNAYRGGKAILQGARAAAATMPIIGLIVQGALLVGGLFITGYMQTSAINELNKQYGTYLNTWSNSKNYAALTVGTIVNDASDTINFISWLVQLPGVLAGGQYVSMDEAAIINTELSSNQYRMQKIHQFFGSHNRFNQVYTTRITTQMIRGIGEISNRQISRLNEVNAELQTLQQQFSSIITKKQRGETITENDIIKLSVIINKISDFASDMYKVFNNDYGSFIKKILAVLPDNYNYEGGKGIMLPDLIKPIILYMVECIKTNVSNKYISYIPIANAQIEKIKQIIDSNDKYTDKQKKNVIEYITKAKIPQSFTDVLNDFKNIKNTLNDSKKIYFNFIIQFLLTYVIMPYNSVDEAISSAKQDSNSVLQSFIATVRIYDDDNNGNTNTPIMSDADKNTMDTVQTKDASKKLIEHKNYLKYLKEFQKINNIFKRLSNSSTSILETWLDELFKEQKDKILKDAILPSADGIGEYRSIRCDRQSSFYIKWY